LLHGLAGLSFDKSTEPEQFFNAGILTIVASAWTAEPRLNLGIQMLKQAMSTTPIRGNATIVSLGTSPSSSRRRSWRWSWRPPQTSA
jgi:hypothetical protein